MVAEGEREVTLTSTRKPTENVPDKPQRRDYPMIGLWIGLVVTCLIWAVPFIFMVFTSLKTQTQISTGSAFSLPSTWEWGNYSTAADRGNLWQAGGNSLFIAVIKVPLGLLLSAMAAFAIARLRFKWHRVLLLIIAVGSMIPVQVALAPMFTMMSSLGLLNSNLGVVLPYLAFGIPYQIFFLYGFFRAIPAELDEAARLDGAGNFRLFFSVILPVSRPALAALFILDFVATWNEYAIALTLLQSEASRTIPLSLQSFQTQFTSSYGQLNAFIIMSIVPVLIVYLMFQRFFTSGALAGSVKG
jgi:raffinose/stachyose/melibiose transport system permease protein